MARKTQSLCSLWGASQRDPEGLRDAMSVIISKIEVDGHRSDVFEMCSDLVESRFLLFLGMRFAGGCENCRLVWRGCGTEESKAAERAECGGCSGAVCSARDAARLEPLLTLPQGGPAGAFLLHYLPDLEMIVRSRPKSSEIPAECGESLVRIGN